MNRPQSQMLIGLYDSYLDNYNNNNVIIFPYTIFPKLLEYENTFFKQHWNALI